MEIGPVLSEEDAVANKVGAVYTRVEARDLIRETMTTWSDQITAQAQNPQAAATIRCAQAGLEPPGSAASSELGMGEAQRGGAPYDYGCGPDGHGR